MTVLCCPVNPHPDAMSALAHYAPHAEIIEIPADDNYAYWREIRSRWEGVRDLIIIEQDIEIGPDTIAELENCDQDWCCFAYPIFRTKVRLRVGLGCTKISARAQQMVTAEKIAEGFTTCAACRGQGCWWHLDGRIANQLKRGGFFPHVHGDVVHHHDYGKEAEGHPEGRPIEWMFEEDFDPEPALIINPSLMDMGKFAPSESPSQAAAMANDIIRVCTEIKEFKGLHTKSAGLMAPFPLGVIPEPKAYDTDKVQQGYMPAYNGIADLIGVKARVCEVGVFRGASLATWKDLFPKGLIVGVDLSSGAIWPEGTVKVVASQDDLDLPDKLLEHADAYELIVDDASHDGRLSAATFELLWPLVAPGGFYVIEDWFVGFPEYNGPCKSPDMLVLAESMLGRLRYDSDTESVSYRYGMAIVRKKL